MINKSNRSNILFLVLQQKEMYISKTYVKKNYEYAKSRDTFCAYDSSKFAQSITKRARYICLLCSLEFLHIAGVR